MSMTRNECYCCGKDLVLGKVVEIEAWYEDCLYDVELVCKACEAKIRKDGRLELTRGERRYILRPCRLRAAAD